MNFLSLIQMLLGGMKGMMGGGGGPFSTGPVGMSSGDSGGGMPAMMAMQAPPPVQQPQQSQQVDPNILGSGMAYNAGNELQQRNNRLKMMLDQIGR